MRSDRYYVQYIRGSFSWVASGIYSRFFKARVVRRMHQYGYRSSDYRFHYFMFLVEAWIASAVICACTTLFLFVFFPGVFLSSGVTGACPVTTDLIMRVNVRTTTTLATRRRSRPCRFLLCTVRVCQFKVYIATTTETSFVLLGGLTR